MILSSYIIWLGGSVGQQILQQRKIQPSYQEYKNSVSLCPSDMIVLYVSFKE